MNKAQFILIFVSIVAITGLFFLPKVVVSDESSTLSSTIIDSVHTDSQVDNIQIKSDYTFDHKLVLFASSSDFSDSLTLTANIISDFQSLQYYDSAAFFSSWMADTVGLLPYLLLAGESYYEAFTYAVSPERIQLFAEGTRKYYEKALSIEADLPVAKVHIGMTMVNSDNPMQGILMIRSVLEEYPENEQALFSLGVLSMQSGQFAKALERFSTLEEIGKGTVQTAFYRGICLNELGEKNKAMQVLKDALHQAEDESVKSTIQKYIDEL